jgi:hypothetical protein
VLGISAKQIEKMIFDSLLTTIEVSCIFEATWAIAKIGLSLKPNQKELKN